ncbi:IS30 family transposase [Vagococcus carniphilus]|uniref:IS30 family transposase n=1 Tax=Vagococcus carniphilus TaxID=218144 RepID=A0AAW8UAB7_9ENTE|nr:IS30 family transposase [Vagococcus carniphilus]MDT2835282.1 IS30 family transposase [Vagococcus carniphilus]
MTYTHLTTDELVLIESYHKISKPVLQVAKILNRSRQTIYNVYKAMDNGVSALDYYKKYKQNKKNCGRRPISLPELETEYIEKMVVQGWTPDVIIGRGEIPISCSVRTLYHMFSRGIFNKMSLPMKGKRKSNGHKEKRGKQAFKRSIHDRKQEHIEFNTEFGHLEGDTIVGAHHKSAVITLVERLSKVIITLKPSGRQAVDIENSLNNWFKQIPKHLFKSITFDCGKEFSNWKEVSNHHDIDIYFADPGTPSQRGLNENSNGLLRKDGLPKRMDFNQVDDSFIQSVASRRNNIPRKSLNYKTPLEVFLSYVDNDILSSLI